MAQKKGVRHFFLSLSVIIRVHQPAGHQRNERGGAGAAARALPRLRRGQLRAHREERVPHHLRGAAGVRGRGGQDL